MLLRQGKGRDFDLWKATCWARTYWHRLAGCAGSWFIWDFSFYGNKLFQGRLIEIMSPGATVLEVCHLCLSSLVMLPSAAPSCSRGG